MIIIKKKKFQSICYSQMKNIAWKNPHLINTFIVIKKKKKKFKIHILNFIFSLQRKRKKKKERPI